MSAHQPLFERLTPLLGPFHPAELHGLLCGLLCGEGELALDRWLQLACEALADGVELAPPVQNLLAKLLDYGVAQLSDPDGSITPLLPDDDAPLPQRVDALGDWCQGLLYGLGISHVEQHDLLSEEGREFLRDVADIAHVGLDQATSETDETAYVEVVEYLRVGLLIIHHDLRLAAVSDSSCPS
ncbi:MAG: UPF0149 family protein [Candidatus Contendobacter sp.]|nr:UPF0149 family protein [Candidatus Contendobacter sp.]